jgi:hypothetical protein
MVMPKAETINITTSADIVRVRQAVRQMAVELKFSLVDQTKLSQQQVNSPVILWTMEAVARWKWKR